MVHHPIEEEEMWDMKEKFWEMIDVLDYKLVGPGYGQIVIIVVCVNVEGNAVITEWTYLGEAVSGDEASPTKQKQITRYFRKK